MDAESKYIKNIEEAFANYSKYIICLDKTPDEFLDSITRLAHKAKKAFDEREKCYKNGIAMDRHVTIIFSENPENKDQPICNIYFNLSSDYFEKLKSK